MSSGPVGLDAREHGYAKTFYVIPDGLTHFLGTRGAWLVTRIQFYAAAVPAFISVEGAGGGPGIDVAANGTACLEPNGAHRGEIIVAGAGARLIVEWWWQSNPTKQVPPVYIL